MQIELSWMAAWVSSLALYSRNLTVCILSWIAAHSSLQNLEDFWDQSAVDTLFLCLHSYPYSEDSSQGEQYMNTRCPAWCDRILMSLSAKELVLKVGGSPGLAMENSPAWGPLSRPLS